MSANRTIRYYEEDDNGNRIPCTLELDATLLKVAHYRDTSATGHAARGRNERRRKRAELTPAQKLNAALGKWQVAAEENPIPGSDDLRAEFFEERLRLSTKGKCQGCTLSRLVKKYKLKMRDAGLLKQFLV